MFRGNINHKDKSDSEIKSICKKYKIFKDFRQNDNGLYGYLKKHGLLEKYTSHMYKVNNKTKEITDSEIKLICKKYKLYFDFRQSEPSLLKYLRRKGLLEKYTSHMERLWKKTKEMTDSEIKLICKKYKLYYDFRQNEKSLLRYLQTRGLLEKYTSHMERLWEKN